MPTDMIPKPAESKAVELYTPQDGAEFDNLEREDFKLPVYRIVQATSRYAPPTAGGKYWNSVTQEASDTLEVAILRVAKTRILFPEAYAADSPILCASDDSMHPRNQFVGTRINDQFGIEAYTIPESCDNCVLMAWSPTGSPPPCSLSYKYVIVDMATGMPGILALKRTDVGTARALNTLLRTGGMRKLRLSSEFVQADQGQWFAFRYNVLPGFTKDEVDMVQGVAGIAKGASVSADAGEEQAPSRAARAKAGNDALFGPEEDEIPF